MNEKQVHCARCGTAIPIENIAGCTPGEYHCCSTECRGLFTNDYSVLFCGYSGKEIGGVTRSSDKAVEYRQNQYVTFPNHKKAFFELQNRARVQTRLKRQNVDEFAFNKHNKGKLRTNSNGEVLADCTTT